jgi:hypothetical protein
MNTQSDQACYAAATPLSAGMAALIRYEEVAIKQRMQFRLLGLQQGDDNNIAGHQKNY